MSAKDLKELCKRKGVKPNRAKHVMVKLLRAKLASAGDTSSADTEAGDTSSADTVELQIQVAADIGEIHKKLETIQGVVEACHGQDIPKKITDALKALTTELKRVTKEAASKEVAKDLKDLRQEAKTAAEEIRQQIQDALATRPAVVAAPQLQSGSGISWDRFERFQDNQNRRLAVERSTLEVHRHEEVMKVFDHAGNKQQQQDASSDIIEIEEVKKKKRVREELKLATWIITPVVRMWAKRVASKYAYTSSMTQTEWDVERQILVTDLISRVGEPSHPGLFQSTIEYAIITDHTDHTDMASNIETNLEKAMNEFGLSFISR